MPKPSEAERPDLPANRSMQGEVCWGCGFIRPLEEFTEQDWSAGPGGVELLCLACRTDGPPEVQETVGWEHVHPRHRRLLEAIFVEGKRYADVAREFGLHPRTGLNDALANSPALRRAYQALLRQRGLDLVYLSGKLRVMMNARKPMWNPRDLRWDWFPDNQAQMKALELAHKLHDTLPKFDAPPQEGPRVIVIAHNLDRPMEVAIGHQGKLVAEVPGPVIEMHAEAPAAAERVEVPR